MLPKELIAIIEKLDPDKPIICQVVGAESGVANCHFKFTAGREIEERIKHPCCFNVLTVEHPDLLTLGFKSPLS